jgi:hypothetical protein
MTRRKTHKTLTLNNFQNSFELIESKLQDDIEQFSIFFESMQLQIKWR